MAFGFITRRGGGGGGGLEDIASGNIVVSVGGQTSSTTGMEQYAYYRGCVQCNRYGNEKTGYVCWASDWTTGARCHVALVDWENQTVTQVFKGGSYPYQPSYGYRFMNTTCILAVSSSEWDGETEVCVMYISEQ